MLLLVSRTMFSHKIPLKYTWFWLSWNILGPFSLKQANLLMNYFFAQSSLSDRLHEDNHWGGHSQLQPGWGRGLFGGATGLQDLWEAGLPDGEGAKGDQHSRDRVCSRHQKSLRSGDVPAGPERRCLQKWDCHGNFFLQSLASCTIKPKWPLEVLGSNGTDQWSNNG